MISLNSSPCSNPISILMRLSRFLSEIIFMHRRAEPVNTPCIPCCPNDPTLPMKYEGTSKLRNDVKRYKFVCPKIKWQKDDKTGRNCCKCTCENPCTSSTSGRMVYTYPEKDLRAYPGTLRGTDDWDKTYKIRTSVERDINHIKDNYCLFLILTYFFILGALPHNPTEEFRNHLTKYL